CTACWSVSMPGLTWSTTSPVSSGPHVPPLGGAEASARATAGTALDPWCWPALCRRPTAAVWVSWCGASVPPSAVETEAPPVGGLAGAVITSPPACCPGGLGRLAGPSAAPPSRGSLATAPPSAVEADQQLAL